mgnify:CR=1 FL=1|jgi:hypothetical protein
MSAKQLTVSYTEFDPSRVGNTTVEENERSKGQLIGYMRYDNPKMSGEDNPLMMQLPWSSIFTYGVPREGEYYKTDYDRGFIKYPIDTENEQQMEFVSKMQQVDEVYSSKDKKADLFGKKSKKYKYTPIYRESQVDEDDEDAKARPAYMKFKLDLSWPDGEVKTKVYTSEVNDDGKRVRTEQEVKTVDDFAGIVRWNSKIRPIIRPVKIWAQPASRKDPGYGIVWKIVKIEVEPSKSNNGLYQSFYNNDTFLDSDDEDDQDTKLPATVVDDNSSSDSDSDSDSDDETPVVKKKSKKKGKSLKSSA